jgi:hypothetical protein
MQTILNKKQGGVVTKCGNKKQFNLFQDALEVLCDEHDARMRLSYDWKNKKVCGVRCEINLNIEN